MLSIEVEAFLKSLRAGDVARAQELLATLPALGAARDEAGRSAAAIAREMGNEELIALFPAEDA